MKWSVVVVTLQRAKVHGTRVVKEEERKESRRNARGEGESARVFSVAARDKGRGCRVVEE